MREIETVKFSDPEKILLAIEQVDRAIQITSDVTLVLDNVVHEVLQIFQSDRAWLFFPCNPNVSSFEVTFESTKPSYPGAKSLKETVPMTKDMAEYCHRALSKVGEPGVDPPVGRTMTNDIAIHFDVESLMFMALQPQIGDAWMFGLHQCDHRRVWSDEDKALFKILGRRITDCIGNMLYLNHLRESESKFRTLFNHSSDGILLADAETKKLTMCNPKICEMLGFEAHELTGLSVHDIHPIENHPDVFDTFERQLRKEIGASELPVQGKDRSIFFANINAAPINMDGKQFLLGTFRDVTERKRAEETLKNSERKWRNILVNIPQIGITLDTEARIVFANEYFLNLTGWKDHEVIGRNWFDMFIPDHRRGEVQTVFQNAMDQKDSLGYSTYENEIIDKYRNLLNIGWSNVLTKDADGHICDVTCLGVDLTERQRSEQKLKDSETKYRTILKSAMDGFWLTDIQGRLIEVNDAYCKMSGYSEDELLTMHISDLEAVEDPQLVSKHMQKVIMQGWDRFESRHHRKDGTVYDIEVSIQFRQEDGGQCVCFLRDITERIEAENALSQSEKKFREILESTREVHYRQNFVTAQLDYMSPSVFHILGYSVEEVVGMDFERQKALFHPEDLPGLLDFRDEMLEADRKGERFVEKEFRMLHKSGDIRWINGNYFLVKSSKGEPLYIVGTLRDITDYMNAQETLRISKEKYHGIFDESIAAIYLFDKNKNFIDSNKAGLDLLGYSRNELLNMSIPDVDADSVVVLPAHKKLLEGGRLINYEHKLKRKDGSLITVLNNSRPITDGLEQVVGMLSTLIDITEKKQAEEDLKKSELRFRELTEMLPEAIFEADLEMNLIYVNQQAFSLFGYTHEDFEKGLNALDMISSEDRKRARENITERFQGKDLGMTEYSALRKDGFKFPVLLHASPIIDQGAIRGMRGIIIDITDRKKIESKIQQAQKMVSIGNLSGGIAHDFNNILFPIVGMAELLMEDFPRGSQAYENAEEIYKAGRRGSDLVKQILAFSRQSEHKFIPVRIQQILKEALKLSRSTIPSYIEMDQNIQNDCGLVLADATQIHQVAMNMITNAYHAVESGGGKITVELNAFSPTPDELQDLSLSAGQYAHISIADTGHGMSSDLLVKIFEPYFTTKEKGKGTGLGLAVAYGIIKEHRGEIKVTSQIGKGSTFSIYLPLMDKQAGVVLSEDMKPHQTGTERILLVDDEEPTANVEQKMLERLGYRVTCRLNSVDALEAFRAKPSSFDLVITDMSMPNIPGDKLAQEIKSIRSDVPIIMCTGFSERIDEDNIGKMGINGLLMKPVVKADLAKTVRKVLDEAKDSDQG